MNCLEQNRIGISNNGDNVRSNLKVREDYALFCTYLPSYIYCNYLSQGIDYTLDVKYCTNLST
ncbi:hypothetical protein PASE110613_07640 [Paenibacillus sediminis]|uniref:Uncharacterized protein n=1 Tax=Paenibacillus sediminis TaxID=664909 RepID=A0ABS4H3C4_9BACL|nr:hypothetical protein [Paenibacillus sediminis]